jgi:antitoxin HigA-1
MSRKKLTPIRPGEILLEDFMVPYGLSAHRLSLLIRVPHTRITDILREKSPRAITPETALRLAKLFGTTAEFWINMQAHYDLQMAEDEYHDRIEREVHPLAAEIA